MFPLTTEHRDIEIRYGYDITTDNWRANFVLPVGRTMTISLHTTTPISHPPRPIPPDPGKNHAEGDTEGEALARARSMIDSYLDDA